jgi:hypothetical protein
MSCTCRILYLREVKIPLKKDDIFKQ